MVATIAEASAPKPTPAREPLIPLDAAAEQFKRVHGRAPSARTVRRWALHGLGGVRLRSVRIGKANFTTESAIGEFVDALWAMQNAPAPSPAPRGRPRASTAAAERALEAAGVRVK